ncbi:phage tail protein [Campylobacter pinnipediorum]|uniref:Phage P2 family tail protein n=1 Tax=Campylobacter pinnipediorum subsp. pinnipediorum TaxID=1660067 RepID=A0AAX0L9D7_9BACT|nr:phage tail protein [Campylobacter pinnipediorum]AQW81282.1 phage P2 family tail protein [Campylobacter pinnipediorum subsp. pinnipediorum]AQW82908.1 phage P2 family tail protein [Campylobacter pinnipediorum subsp. pinnipediorum]OPA77251.1 hypothetical protein BFG04_03920 [Campylobacter pinnipediorum subsp. pinnipediorum]
MFDVEPKSRSLEETKELLKEQIKTYFNEGTFNAIEKALRGLYADTKISNWYEYDGEPYHFKIELDSSKNGVNFDELTKVDEIANTYKNVRSVFDGASIKVGINTNINAASFTSISEDIVIYPAQIKNISTNNNYFIGSYTKLAEIISTQTINLKGELE